ncbi:hypothetical protein AVEN_30971-1 [Araneus ventricosus]|uniref:ATP-dependent DNA helicase n=1 Tax=Araneus ventricosus TaxID=182803 RepID=A0A4Y2M029_ARAVE|nr:hypothetical protein AVEN_30971-1 [Araneus ventricosus]
MPYNQDDEREEAEQRISSLNREQLAAFETITRAIRNNNENDRYFFLDGLGSSGKTFLYSTLLSFIRDKGDIALSLATTGIEPTLLKGGRTVHSGFKLPVPLLDTSVSSMRPISPEVDKLRQAVLIISDEITMLTKDGLRCIDSLLRDLMNNDKPFGVKVIIIGGDFRQTLPVVPRGTRADVIESCIKSSPLWSKFTHLSLITNIRCAGQTEHNMWLLIIRSGNLPEISGLPCDSIEILQQTVVEENLIEAIYSENLNDMEVEQLAKRVILAPTNKKILEMNRLIIEKLQGEPHTFYSSDSIIPEDQNDLQNYPPEFLHDLTS